MPVTGRVGLVLAGGQGKLAGRIVRMGHLGAVTVEDVIAALAVVEAGLVELGLPVPTRGEALAVAARAAAEVSSDQGTGVETTAGAAVPA